MTTFDTIGRITLAKSVKLKPYVHRPFKDRPLMTEQEILDGAGGTLILDTETYMNYHLIAFKDYKTKKYIKLELNQLNDEYTLEPRKLAWILQSYRIVTFNGIRYDMPIVWYGHSGATIDQIKQLSDTIIFQDVRPRELAKQFGFMMFATNHIDMIEVLPGKHSLKLYMSRIHSKRIQDLPFSPHDDLKDWQVPIVSDYCMNDLDGTEELFEFSKERLELREALGRDYAIDLRSKSDAQMAEAMISKEIHNKTGAWPKKNIIPRGTTFWYERPLYLKFATPQFQKLLEDVCSQKFIITEWLLRPDIFKEYYVSINQFKCKFGIGGLHSCEENVNYKENDDYRIIDRDVTGYYPNIITSQKLYPEHLGPVFLEVYNTMKEDREKAKANKQMTKSNGLKIATNGISGKFNSEYSIVYSPKCYIQMTMTGQLSILMLVEMLECNGIKVISANTDGIVIYCKREDYQKLTYWVDYWEKLTSFKTEETEYSAYYGRDINAYFAVKLNGEVKVKGPYSEIGSQTGTKVDNNPITLICSDAIKAFLSKNIPIEQTIEECKDFTRFVVARNVKGGAYKNGEYLGKVVRWYFAKNTFGSVNYIDTNNKVADSDGAKPVMDLPEVFPEDIDYSWYINKTIVMLYDIGYYKRPTQLKFF